jgi:hypothetical protein
MTWRTADLKRFCRGGWISITGGAHVRLYYGISWTGRLPGKTKYFIDNLSDNQILKYLNDVKAEIL